MCPANSGLDWGAIRAAWWRHPWAKCRWRKCLRGSPCTEAGHPNGQLVVEGLGERDEEANSAAESLFGDRCCVCVCLHVNSPTGGRITLDGAWKSWSRNLRRRRGGAEKIDPSEMFSSIFFYFAFFVFFLFYFLLSSSLC